MSLVDELFDEMTYARDRLIDAMLDGEESEFLLNHLVAAFEQRNTLCLAASSKEPRFNKHEEVVNEIWYSTRRLFQRLSRSEKKAVCFEIW